MERRFGSDSKTIYSCGLVLIGVFILLPFILNPEESYFIYFLYLSFIYVAIAQGWNLVAGYAGQISLGQHAFFGLGAYVTGISWRSGWIGYFDPLGMFMSGVIAALLAILIGIPLLNKLRGDYFAIGTLGLGEILRTVFVNGGSFTGGPMGFMLPSSAYQSMRHYYLIALTIALFTLVMVWLVIRSRIGLALVAIREDEVAASANGVPVLRFKTLAFCLGAFFTGLCGSLNAYYVFHIHPAGVCSLHWALLPILMTLLGGEGTFLGPIFGAFILAGIFEVSNIYMPEIHPVFSGALIVLITLFLPRGIMNLSPGYQGTALRKLLPFRWVPQKNG